MIIYLWTGSSFLYKITSERISSVQFELMAKQTDELQGWFWSFNYIAGLTLKTLIKRLKYYLHSFNISSLCADESYRQLNPPLAVHGWLYAFL